MSKNMALVESRTLREAHIDRVEVLDKVKKLALLPGDVNTSIELTAEYYEVGQKTIEKTIERYRDEVERDGLRVLRGRELSDFKSEGVIGKNAASFTIVPRRAVLRIGMTLEKSPIATAIRDYLLDTEEQAEHRKPFSIDGMSEDEQFELAKVAFKRWEEERDRRKQLEAEKKKLLPKAEVYDDLVDTSTTVSLRDAAKLIGAKPIMMNRFLMDQGYLFYDAKKVIKPYQRFIDKGWFELKESKQNEHIRLQTRVTQTGIFEIRKLVLEANIPGLLVERRRGTA